MLRSLLMAGGLGAARLKIAATVRSAMFTIAGAIVLALSAVVALGFAAAAGFLYFDGFFGPIAACLIMAVLSLALGIITWMVLSLLNKKAPAPPQRSPQDPAAAVVDGLAKAVADNGVKALLAAVVVGFLVGQSSGRGR